MQRCSARPASPGAADRRDAAHARDRFLASASACRTDRTCRRRDPGRDAAEPARSAAASHCDCPGSTVGLTRHRRFAARHRACRPRARYSVNARSTLSWRSLRSSRQLRAVRPMQAGGSSLQARVDERRPVFAPLPAWQPWRGEAQPHGYRGQRPRRHRRAAATKALRRLSAACVPQRFRSVAEHREDRRSRAEEMAVSAAANASDSEAPRPCGGLSHQNGLP